MLTIILIHNILNCLIDDWGVKFIYNITIKPIDVSYDMYRMIAQVAPIEFKELKQQDIANLQQKVIVNKKIIEELLK